VVAVAAKVRGPVECQRVGCLDLARVLVEVEVSGAKKPPLRLAVELCDVHVLALEVARVFAARYLGELERLG
jgi:hypothetical protein